MTHRPPIHWGCLPHPRRQRGAALLLAMLTVTLVATLASAALWQQWRHTEVEQAERERQQAGWILTGALDWARLILREDGRTNQNTGAGDHLSEPWAIGLQEARLSSFLAVDKSDDPPPTLDAFLSGAITDMQGRLNVANLVDQGKLSEPDVQAFERLFEQLGLPPTEVSALARQWLAASQPAKPPDGQPDIPPPAGEVPLLPRRLAQLTWLGLPPTSVQALAPFATVLPERTPVNLNTAGVEVLVASIPGLDTARARRLLEQRALRPFKTLADAAAVLGGSTPALQDRYHATNSRYFQVLGRLRLGDRVVQERSLVVRNGLDTRTLWRERTAASAQALSPEGQALSLQ